MANEFPATLGPFGITPTGLIPIVDYESWTYELPAVPGVSPAGDVGHTSSIQPLTLTDAERHIKPSAASFCWAYPLAGQGSGMQRMSDEEKAKVDAAFDKATLFITFGGFLYFDVNNECVQARGV